MSILESPSQGQGKKYITAYLGYDEVRKLDEFRGEISRNRVVRKAINQFLERELSKKAAGDANNTK